MGGRGWSVFVLRKIRLLRVVEALDEATELFKRMERSEIRVGFEFVDVIEPGLDGLPKCGEGSVGMAGGGRIESGLERRGTGQVILVGWVCGREFLGEGDGVLGRRACLGRVTALVQESGALYFEPGFLGLKAKIPRRLLQSRASREAAISSFFSASPVNPEAASIWPRARYPETTW